MIVGRAAEAAGAGASCRRRGRGPVAAGAAGARDAAVAASALEVTAVTVLPAGEEPVARRRRGEPGDRRGHGRRTGCPGIRDEHEDDDAGWQARWLDRPTWDRTVTPNVSAARAGAGRGADEDRRSDDVTTCCRVCHERRP